MNAILSVFRCIIRHTNQLNDPLIRSSVVKLKRQIRKPIVSAQNYRSRITQIFDLEKGLRDVCEGKFSIARIRSIWGIGYEEIERNQNSMYVLYHSQDQRRFDKYNNCQDSPETASAKHRKVQFSNCYANFVNNGMRGSVSDINSQDSVVIGTILAPFYKMCHSRPKQQRPRSVKLKSFTRNSGKLSVLSVRGIPIRLSGFRRHVSAVDADYIGRTDALEDQIWLAKQYSQDPLDGEDMNEWIQHLNEEKIRVKNRHKQQLMKVEVYRRILLSRQARLAAEWEWKWKRKVQNQERNAKLCPRKLLTLDTL